MAMQAFTEVSSQTIPLALDQVDTDQIIPAAFLTSVSRDGYGENLFRGLRERDPEFVLNDPRYAGREIMIVGENFGCGSSREHAVWALTGFGIRVVIGKSFADIFSANSANNGLLLLTLESEVVDDLLRRSKEEDDFVLSVSLQDLEVRLRDGSTYSFTYDPFRRHCLLEGLDTIDYIHSKVDEISGFREKQASKRFARRI